MKIIIINDVDQNNLDDVDDDDNILCLQTELCVQDKCPQLPGPRGGFWI